MALDLFSVFIHCVLITLADSKLKLVCSARNVYSIKLMGTFVFVSYRKNDDKSINFNLSGPLKCVLTILLDINSNFDQKNKQTC